MIHGIGTDIVTITRLAGLQRRFGDRVLEKILAAEERPACCAAGEPARFLAKRFAAKEALAKALGTGVRAPVLLPEIAVTHDALGKPVFAFSSALSTYMREHGLIAHLSISDERDMVIAFVVVEHA